MNEVQRTTKPNEKAKRAKIVTITRQIGSWGDYAAVSVAKSLNYRYIDREITERAMAQAGLSPQQVEEGRMKEDKTLIKRVIGTLKKLASTPSIPSQAMRFSHYYSFQSDSTVCEGLMREGFSKSEAIRHICTTAFAQPTPTRPSGGRALDYLNFFQMVILNFAEQGNVVLGGTGCQAILREWPEAFHVFFYAPLEARISAIIEQEAVTRKVAHRRVTESDEAQRLFMERFYNVNLMESQLYDLCINTGKTSWNDAAEMIMELFKRRDGIVSNLS